jgi:hypothetical protein
MESSGEHQSIEHDINALRVALEKHVGDGAHTTSELAADMTRAVHNIGDHVVALHHRVEKLEQGETEWTTRGWEPPPGADRGPGETP